MGKEPRRATGGAGAGWCVVVRRRRRHKLRGAVQGVHRMGAGRNHETVSEKMCRESRCAQQGLGSRAKTILRAGGGEWVGRGQESASQRRS